MQAWTYAKGRHQSPTSTTQHSTCHMHDVYTGTRVMHPGRKKKDEEREKDDFATCARETISQRQIRLGCSSEYYTVYRYCGASVALSRGARLHARPWAAGFLHPCSELRTQVIYSHEPMHRHGEASIILRPPGWRIAGDLVAAGAVRPVGLPRHVVYACAPRVFEFTAEPLLVINANGRGTLESPRTRSGAGNSNSTL